MNLDFQPALKTEHPTPYSLVDNIILLSIFKFILAIFKKKSLTWILRAISKTCCHAKNDRKVFSVGFAPSRIFVHSNRLPNPESKCYCIMFKIFALKNSVGLWNVFDRSNDLWSTNTYKTRIQPGIGKLAEADYPCGPWFLNLMQ